MCGRYFVDVEFEELMKRYGIYSSYGLDDMKTGEIFPTNKSPVIVGAHNEIALTGMKWGYDFSYMKNIIINSRVETISEKNMFKGSVNTKRCIIPAEVFFEWKKVGKEKFKKSITIEDEKIISFGGLYTDITNKNNQLERCFVIITRAANDSMVEVHDRMPLIIGKEMEKEWLDPQVRFSEILKEALMYDPMVHIG